MKIALVALLFVCAVLFPSYWAYVPGFREIVVIAAHAFEVIAGLCAMVLAIRTVLKRRSK